MDSILTKLGPYIPVTQGMREHGDIMLELASQMESLRDLYQDVNEVM